MALNQLTVISNGETSLSIDKKQILSATSIKNDEALFRFVQQPEIIPTPLHMPINIEADTEKDDDSYRTHQEMAIVPYTAPNDQPVMAIPLSAIPQGFVRPQPLSHNEVVIGSQGEPSTAIGGKQLTLEERKKNWFIRFRQRSSNPKKNGSDPKKNGSDPKKKDWFYVHVQTDKQLKSLAEVHRFIVQGRLPPAPRAKKETPVANALGAPKERRVRGDKMLRKILVGKYNVTTKEILRTPETNPPPESGDKKRKREDETMAPSGASTNTGHLIFDLYDFEPIM